MIKNDWWVYIVQCRDGSLYTGCALNVEKRLASHNAGSGAKYTRARLPVQVVYQEKVDSRSAALIREADIKKLTRVQKWALIEKCQFQGSIRV